MKCNRKIWQGLLVAMSIILVYQCVPYQPDRTVEVNLDFENDETLRKIINYQDQRMTDSLITYLDHPNATYRYVAAMGIGSTKNEKALYSLSKLLNDDVEDVRTAAAYAIGQIGSPSGEEYLKQAFEQFDSLRNYTKSNAAILEAIGKVGNDKSLEYLSTISTYKVKDSLLLEGQAWGIYRYALRKKTLRAGTEVMVSYVTSPQMPDRVKLIAANYLGRANISADSLIAPVCPIVKDIPNPYIRQSLALALGKSQMDYARDTLVSWLRTEEDYRVSCNIIRGLKNFDYASVFEVILEKLFSSNPHVSLCAADYFYEKGIPSAASNYLKIARTVRQPLAKYRMMAASNKHYSYYYTNSKTAISQELISQFDSLNNQYHQATILMALAEYPRNYDYIKEKTLDNETPLMKSTGMKAINVILSNPDFDNYFGLGARKKRQEIYQDIEATIRQGDSGATAIAATMLANEALNLKNALSSVSLLDTILQSLSLPEEIETYNEMVRAINHLRNDSLPEKKPNYNHPINWKNVSKVAVRSRAIMKTTKGIITLEFLPEYAPASVDNFIRLAEAGYFDGKYIHRVVPNFVIQAGDIRGDGYGGADFSIRSELPYLHYDTEGLVGMASAGNDTESTQWFITHSPTPHLDGLYTIFARVNDGMENVHKLELGDKIERIVIRL